MAPSDSYDIDPQDQAEVFDEDNYSEDGAGDISAEMRTFEELPDVYDVTSAVGDDDDDAALIGEELDDEEIIELQSDTDMADLEDDELAARMPEAYDEEDESLNEFEPEDDLGEARASAPSGEDVELQFTGDVDDVTDTDDEDVEAYESSQVSDQELRRLGYPDQDDPPEGSGPSADDVEDEADPRQDELLDEGVEETFPASDPVSVKRIT